jgi:magnesium transporter
VLSVFVPNALGLTRRELPADGALPAEAIWLDLREPKPEEEKRVEEFLAIDVPTREEMREIETSNRLYEEGGALYMTVTLVTKLDSDVPENNQVTFVLKGHRLVTNRYVDPLPFRAFIAYAEKHLSQCSSGPLVFAGVLEAIVNRIADVLERAGADLDAISAEVFAPRRRRSGPRDFRNVLQRIGHDGDLVGKARESLGSLSRALVFVQQTATDLAPDVRSRLKTISRDVAQMADHAGFLGNKVNFILDATLGMVNIDQNNILKIFSVVTVVLLPPSVIGAAFGMNFDIIPTAHAPWGFAAALSLMLISAVVPFLIFKWRGWL